jgi:hypothetical protein
VPAVAVAVGAVGVTLRTYRPSRLDPVKTTALETTSSWIASNVPPGSTIAFAAVLAYETADTLQGRYRIRQIREDQNLLFDASAPLGLKQLREPLADDWIAVDVSPNVNGRFYGYRAGELEARLAREQPVVWTVSSLRSTRSTVPILDALKDVPGIRLQMSWAWPVPGGSLDTNVFAIDANTVNLDERRMYVTQPALEELADLLGRAGESGRAAAARLAARVTPVPDDANGQALIGRLKALGGQ